MRNATAAGLLVATGLFFSACASSGSRDVEVDIVQLVGPQSVQSQGGFDVQYGVQVHNLTGEVITIRNVFIRQVGEGPYRLISDLRGLTRSHSFSTQVPPGTTQAVTLWMHAVQVVLPGELESYEPVNLRVIVSFDSPSGPFKQIVHKMLPQSNQ